MVGSTTKGKDSRLLLLKHSIWRRGRLRRQRVQYRWFRSRWNWRRFRRSCLCQYQTSRRFSRFIRHRHKVSEYRLTSWFLQFRYAWSWRPSRCFSTQDYESWGNLVWKWQIESRQKKRIKKSFTRPLIWLWWAWKTTFINEIWRYGSQLSDNSHPKYGLHSELLR